MAAEKTDGLVIRITDFSETSRIAAVFTKDHGRISALAKGGRRLKGPFDNALDLLATCQMVFLEKSSGLNLLTEARLVRRFQPQANHLGCLYAGYYVAELLLGLTEEHDPYPELYAASIRALDQFSDAALAPKAVLQFELAVLREMGQLPDFESCAACGEEIAEGRVFGFYVQQSGLLCPTCQDAGYAQIALHAGTIAALKRLSAADDPQLDRLVLSAQQYKEARQFTAAAVSHVLGKRPQMLKLLKF